MCKPSVQVEHIQMTYLVRPFVFSSCRDTNSSMATVATQAYLGLFNGNLSGNHVMHSSQASSRGMVCHTCRLPHGF